MINGLLLVSGLLFANFVWANDYAVEDKVFFGDRPFSPEQRKELRLLREDIKRSEESAELRSIALVSAGWDAHYGGESDYALKLFNMAWWLDPTQVLAYEGLFASAYELNDFESARYVGETALGIGLDSAYLWSKMAVAYSLGAKHSEDAYAERARYFIEKTAKSDPKYHHRYVDAMTTYVFISDWYAAEAVFGEAEKAGMPLPQFAVSWYGTRLEERKREKNEQ